MPHTQTMSAKGDPPTPSPHSAPAGPAAQPLAAAIDSVTVSDVPPEAQPGGPPLRPADVVRFPPAPSPPLPPTP